ncbi:MAG: PRC-barrel domain-containing protein [Planctomycetota bacterium]|nr:PRC-barrel domain-containing protein [Planctomycetota bacterium]
MSAGSVADALFEDDTAHLRWVDVDTGSWLPGRRVLLPPQLCVYVPGAGRIHVDMSADSLRECPSIETDMPVRRHYESLMLAHYGLVPYWGMPGGVSFPPLIDADSEREQRKSIEQCHLRSAREVHGYEVLAADEEALGHVEGLVINSDLWQVSAVLIDTRNWFPGGRKVAIPWRWVTTIDWQSHRVRIRLPAAAIDDAPQHSLVEPEVYHSFTESLFDRYGPAARR